MAWLITRPRLGGSVKLKTKSPNRIHDCLLHTYFDSIQHEIRGTRLIAEGGRTTFKSVSFFLRCGLYRDTKVLVKLDGSIFKKHHDREARHIPYAHS